MSELRDVVAFAESVDRSFDEQAEVNAKVEAKLAQHDQALAAIDRAEKNLENMLTVIQDQMREEFRRLRLGIGLPPGAGGNGR